MKLKIRKESFIAILNRIEPKSLGLQPGQIITNIDTHYEHGYHILLETVDCDGSGWLVHEEPPVVSEGVKL